MHARVARQLAWKSSIDMAAEYASGDVGCCAEDVTWQDASNWPEHEETVTLDTPLPKNTEAGCSAAWLLLAPRCTRPLPGEPIYVARFAPLPDPACFCLPDRLNL